MELIIIVIFFTIVFLHSHILIDDHEFLEMECIVYIPKEVAQQPFYLVYKYIVYSSSTRNGKCSVYEFIPSEKGGTVNRAFLVQGTADGE